MRGARRGCLVAWVPATLLLGAWIAWLNRPGPPLRIEPLTRASGAPVIDGSLELARRYAPWIRHTIARPGGRQDLPAPIDFDGNLDGDDNWENLARHELLPTVYYAHLETETHHFLAYHVFHPRDWTRIDLGLHLTHEGDGENLQVVVDKATERVVLLFTQAHYRGRVHTTGIPLVDDDGRPADDGRHAVVRVEAFGHGIVRGDVAHPVAGELTFRPARPGETVAEPGLDRAEPVPYRLESTAAKLWPGVRDGSLIGEGRAFDGVVRYEDARVAIDLPRFHRGDRFSGPLGASRGISPFAVDFGWSAGTLGALFFDPAARYASRLDVPRPWSLEYVDYPFATR